VHGKVGALGEILTQPTRSCFSLDPRCHGECGHRIDVILRGKVISTCLDSSDPWSHVNDFRSAPAASDGRQQTVTDGDGTVVIGQVTSITYRS